MEFAYVVEGKCEFKIDGQSHLLEPGDSFSLDAKLEHTLTALEKSRFFGIYVKDKDR
jgi:quercetin dioxygenase-like cupin family protein